MLAVFKIKKSDPPLIPPLDAKKGGMVSTHQARVKKEIKY